MYTRQSWLIYSTFLFTFLLPSLCLANVFLSLSHISHKSWPCVPLLPEDEDKEHEQHTEGGHIVHSLHQHHQLPPQRRHEPHQLNDP